MVRFGSLLSLSFSLAACQQAPLLDASDSADCSSELGEITHTWSNETPIVFQYAEGDRQTTARIRHALQLWDDVRTELGWLPIEVESVSQEVCDEVVRVLSDSSGMDLDEFSDLVPQGVILSCDVEPEVMELAWAVYNQEPYPGLDGFTTLATVDSGLPYREAHRALILIPNDFEDPVMELYARVHETGHAFLTRAHTEEGVMQTSMDPEVVFEEDLVGPLEECLLSEQWSTVAPPVRGGRLDTGF